MSVMDTGFASESQEKYLMLNQPKLYKAVLNKHGHFGKRHNPQLDKFKKELRNNSQKPTRRR